MTRVPDDAIAHIDDENARRDQVRHLVFSELPADVLVAEDQRIGGGGRPAWIELVALRARDAMDPTRPFMGRTTARALHLLVTALETGWSSSVDHRPGQAGLLELIRCAGEMIARHRLPLFVTRDGLRVVCRVVP